MCEDTGTTRVIDWGVPDWRDPECYGATEEWPECRWRWEFMRRRDDVREAFWRYAQPTFEALKRAPDYDTIQPDEGPTPHHPGFWAMGPIDNEFGMVGIPNPSISDQPMLEGLFVGDYSRIIEGHGSDYTNFDDWRLQYIPAHTVAWVFDMRRPISPQLREASKELISRQDAAGKPVGRRRRDEMWLTYLRVLDAREARASWLQIARSVLNKDPHYQDSAPQAARVAWKQAKKLMDTWPA